MLCAVFSRGRAESAIAVDVAGSHHEAEGIVAGAQARAPGCPEDGDRVPHAFACRGAVLLEEVLEPLVGRRLLLLRGLPSRGRVQPFERHMLQDGEDVEDGLWATGPGCDLIVDILKGKSINHCFEETVVLALERFRSSAWIISIHCSAQVGGVGCSHVL